MTDKVQLPKINLEFVKLPLWADSLGSIEVGKWADVSALLHDPCEDLHEMGKVLFVMKGGKVIRDDLHDAHD